MRRCWLALLLLPLPWLAVTRAGAADDLLQTPACRQAMAALQAREDLVASQAHRRPDAGLETLRRQAARACLGAGADAAAPAQRRLQPPIAVAPVTGAAPVLPRPTPASPPLPRPPAVPLTVTGCDAAGCWASDGSRLQRLGADLLGPGGLCRVQGNLLHCP